MTTITLVSNSPGEVTTFVRPVLAALRERHPDWRCEIALVPCPYATGAEADVIRGWGVADEVWTPRQTTMKWIRGRSAKGKGVVLFLGGDPWHALLLKHRFQVPSLAYFSEPSSWEGTRWLGGFSKVLLGYPGDHSVRGPRFDHLGDLRVDAVTNRLRELAGSSKPLPDVRTLAIFPGSRWLHLKASMGPFLHVVERLHAERPDRRFLMSVSPFVTRERLADAAAKPFNLGLTRAFGRVEGDRLITTSGAEVELVWGDPYEVIARCDLALSLPGTNTAELAIAGKPTVVPLSDRAPVGGGGLLGLLDRLPDALPGVARLKLHLKHRKFNKLRLLALPNQLAGRMVMPEFFVDDELSNLFDFLSELLDNAPERQRIGEDARSVMGPPGAAHRFVDEVEAVLEAR